MYFLDKSILRYRAIHRIDWHQSQGYKVVLVSAPIENWLKGWCDENDIYLLGTKFEVLSGNITGKFSSKNCYGPEKVSRIKVEFDLEAFDEIYAYGDSRGDRELLALADHKEYKPFH